VECLFGGASFRLFFFLGETTTPAVQIRKFLDTIQRVRFIRVAPEVVMVVFSCVLRILFFVLYNFISIFARFMTFANSAGFIVVIPHFGSFVFRRRAGVSFFHTSEAITPSLVVNSCWLKTSFVLYLHQPNFLFPSTF